MRTRSISALLAVACTSAAITSTTWAQDARAEQEQRRALEQVLAAQAEWDRSLVSVDFPGGSLSEYAEALANAAAPAPANIVLRGDTDSVIIGPASLDGVRMSAALEIVAGEYQFDDNRFVVMTKEIREKEGRPVFSVQVLDQSRDRTGSIQQPSARDFLVLQIKELTTALPGDPPESVVPAETVLTAIEAVLEIAGSADDTKVKYHAPSGLVMLSGPVNSLRAAEQVLSQMSRDTSVRRSRARELQTSQGLTNPEMLESELADAQADLELAQVRMHVAAERYELAEQGLGKTQDLVEGGFVHEGELEQRRFRLIESQSEIEECRIEMERQHQRVEQLRRSLDRARAISTGGGNANAIDAVRAENAMLRDRLAVMEAQLAQLQGRLKTQPETGRAGSGAGVGRTGGGSR